MNQHPHTYRSHAENCRTMADLTGSDDLKTEWLRLARAWEAMARFHARVQQYQRPAKILPDQGIAPSA